MRSVTKYLSEAFLVIVIMTVLSVCAFSEDISVSVDGKQLGKYVDIYPGNNLEITAVLAPGIKVVDVELECDEEALCILMEAEIPELTEERHQDEHNVQKVIYIHDTMPAGDYEVDTTVYYLDARGNQKKMTHHTEIEIKATSFSSSLYGIGVRMMSPSIAHELKNKYAPQEIDRVPRELTQDDLLAMDLSSINLTPQDILAGNFVMEEVAYKEPYVQELPDEEIVSLLESSGLGDFLEKFVDSDRPIIEKSFKVYMITNPDSGLSDFYSKVMISIYRPGGINDVEIVEVIPKGVASSAGEMMFPDHPIILEDDPVVKWRSTSIPEGEVQDHAYIVNARISEPGVTVAIGERPSIFAKFVRFCINGGWLLVLFVALLLGIGIPVFLSTRKKR